jgi:LmbE family N-acetylglucosaminyl deacetylase
MKRTIAVIMAHADDIEFSAGGTLARYIGQGYDALYGVLSRCNSGWTVTEEEGGHYAASLEVVPRRRAEASSASKLFGATLYQGDLLENCYTTRDGLRISPSFGGAIAMQQGELRPVAVDRHDIPRGTPLLVAAGRGDTWEDDPTVREVAGLLKEWEPELVIGQPIGNLNADHFAAAQIVAVAWQIAAREIKIGPYWLPVMLPGDDYVFPPQQPDHFVDVSGYEERCLAALACHVSQGGHLRRTQDRRRASWGGWRERCSFTSAEAFRRIYEQSGDHTRTG